MGFDPGALSDLVAAEGPVIRIVVAEVLGSAPREAGAAMLVTARGVRGTIGGGALEHAAIGRARAMLADGAAARLDRVALGPGLGQCCGGAVVLLAERWDAAGLAVLLGPALLGPVLARAVPGGPAAMPLAVRRTLARARDQGAPAPVRLVQGWFVEPVSPARRHLWVWGAGHVGRAIVGVLAPLPVLALSWVDMAADRFPAIPDGVTARVAANPADLVADAPVTADHLILTYSHALDLELCHRLLLHGFAGAGLIGSASKSARFRARLGALGHPAAEISRIRCPIGRPDLGKHPQAIAIGVAAEILAGDGAMSGAMSGIAGPALAAGGQRRG